MRFLLFTLEYPPFYGGVANYYANLVKYWPQTESISVLSNNDGGLLSSWVWPRWLPAIYKLWYHTKITSTDHVIVGQILPLGTAAWLLKVLGGKKYSLFLHGMDLSYCLRSGRKKYIAQRIINQAENIICSSRYTAELLKNNFPVKKEKIAVVNPGIGDIPDLDRGVVENLRQQYNLSGKTVLLSISRLVKRKGFDRVIEIMPELNRLYPDLVYVIAGRGPDEAYLKSKIGKNSNIIFIGPIDDSNKWAWLALCDIFIMPARDIDGDFEGFGIVYLEANLSGKPVIGGRSGGVTDAVADKYSGLLVDPENNQDIRETLIRLLEDSELRQVLGEQGKLRAKTEFNWRGQIQKIYDTLN